MPRVRLRSAGTRLPVWALPLSAWLVVRVLFSKRVEIYRKEMGRTIGLDLIYGRTFLHTWSFLARKVALRLLSFLPLYLYFESRRRGRTLLLVVL